MSATSCSFSIYFTVKDTDHLPDGVYSDDVSSEIEEMLWSTLRDWYDKRGHEFLSYRP